jgi:NADPH:quinone reductase-like Zn-dependent oxidoreductase
MQSNEPFRAAVRASSGPSSSTPPATMRAMIRTAYGAPDTLRLAEIPIPVPKEDELLVQVIAAGIDAGTWHLVAGNPYLMRLFGFGLRAPKTPVPGLAFAGRVSSVGAAVSRFRVGDNVIGSAPGAFAEYLTTAESQVRWMPQELDHAHAAALPISAVTALEAVRDADVQPGHRVLVLGAGGGVGHYAVQLATAAGGQVTGVASAAKGDFVRSLGATEFLDYHSSEPTDLDRTWDVIIDTAGNRPLRRLRRVLAARGTLVIVGGENGGPLLGGTERLMTTAIANGFTRQRLRGLMSRENPADYETISTLVSEGALRPHLDRSFPLIDTAAAIDYVRRGDSRGKVVLSL